jgi:hypothetical protein
MTSKIKVDNINKVSDDSNIIKKCGSTTTVGSGSGTIVVDGSTVTLGRCGGTVALASGASQTGFGRTGTVNWSTTVVTSTPTTGVNGVGYFINATDGAKTVNLPASPSAGDIMAVSDYAQISETNNITIGRNGSNIQGNASDIVITSNGVALTLVFVDSTKGWVVTDSGAEADKEPSPLFVAASGGTETTSGDFKIHTFDSPGTFTVTCAGNIAGSNSVSYVVVAGGGGGGDGRGGGGGGGGFREGKASTDSYTASPLNAPTGVPVTAQAYPITIGAGGAGATSNDDDGNPGNPSVFSTITSTAGGKGGGVAPDVPTKIGGPGGSGGGAGGTFASSDGTNPGGTGNTPPVSPPQGNAGGNGVSNGPPNIPGSSSHGATGGGAGGAGSPATGTPAPGTGGVGVSTSISGSPVAYAGGAGAASDSGRTLGSPCGTGGDGQTPPAPSTTKTGTTNRGGGGGGVRVALDGGNGGSGRVIIRYKFQ